MTARADTFQEWLNSELKTRDLSMRKAAELADLSPTAISDVIAGKRNAGLDFCVGIARALDLPGEVVLRRAGLLPAPPNWDPDADTLIGDFHQLPLDERREVLQIMRLKLEKVRRLVGSPQT